ncbi:hypothetical protein C4552_03510 [Candidatus Parcubacteria bacterium]|nr:MAG: hypothetical protein C4552_03510 [Candidatus Parcubacteria bacterium]
MRVALFMAMSLNGFVADESGSEDFISDANWTVFCALAREKGALIIGRKTLETVASWDADYSFDDLADIPRVVITSRPNQLKTGFIAAASPEDALQKLSAQGIASVLVGGGPTVNSAFMQAGLVHEVIFNIEPVIVGAGKPVFAHRDFTMSLQFKSVQKLEHGIIQVQYEQV